MQLGRVRVVGFAPLRDVTFPFADEAGSPRKQVVVLGGGGVGKTTLVSAIASTRPGHAVALRSRRPGEPSFAVADWLIAAEDPLRPHPLRVASPNAALGEEEDRALLRRREQALFDRRAAEGGFAFAAFSAARWFSRSSVLLGGADRRLGRADSQIGSVGALFEDPARADLARDTKLVLSHPLIAAALARDVSWRWSEEARTEAERLATAVRGAVEPLASLAGYAYVGVEPQTFEPVFERLPAGPLVSFDELPTQARHLVALAALTLRSLLAAWPGVDPRTAEGVALVDEADAHLEPAARRGLVPALRAALPNVQWILATSSPDIALPCDAGDVLALRRMPESDEVRLYGGEQALVH
jgi:hypothetical protein